MRILVLRRLKGWTQGELAKRSGLDQAQISRIEGGACHNIDNIEKVAQGLGIGVADLFLEIKL